MSHIDKRLLQLLDKQDITEVLMRYCRAIDRCDEELLRTVYHPGAWDNHGSFDGTAEDFNPWVIAGLKETCSQTTHSLGNILVELDGDKAHVESYVYSYHHSMRDGAEWEWFFSGRYVDRFEKRGDAWKIAHRITVFDWESTRPAPRDKWLPPGAFPHTGKRSREDPVYAR